MIFQSVYYVTYYPLSVIIGNIIALKYPDYWSNILITGGIMFLSLGCGKWQLF